MNQNKIPEVLALLNSYYSLQCSDLAHTKEWHEAMSYCEYRVKQITGFELSEIPAVSSKALAFLRAIPSPSVKELKATSLLGRVKKDAKVIKRVMGLKHVEALDLIATRCYGYSSFQLMQKQLSQ